MARSRCCDTCSPLFHDLSNVGPAQFAAPKISKQLTGAIVAGDAGHAAARMRAGTAHVQALQWTAIIAVTEQGSCGEKLIEAQQVDHDVGYLFAMIIPRGTVGKTLDHP